MKHSKTSLTLIKKAMAERRPVRAIYDASERLLCPYIIGKSKAGQWRVLVYQYGGESESGLQRKNGKGDWRCFALDKLRDVRLMEAPWQRAESMPGRPKCIDQIEIAVEDQPDRDPQ